MAIIIPSSKTYDRKNPKVRDNVIDRIEVGAVEIVPDNEYKTPVKKESYYSRFTNGDIVSTETKYDDAFSSIINYSYIKLTPIYLRTKITIPKIDDNKWVKEIFHNYTTNNNTKENIPDIDVLIYNKKYESKYEDFFDNAYHQSPRVKNVKRDIDSTTHKPTKINFDVEYETPTYNQGKEEIVKHLSPNLEYSITAGITTVTASIKDKFNNNENIINPTYKENDNSYELDIVLLVGYEELKYSGHVRYWFNGDEAVTPTYNEYEMIYRDCVKIEPQKVDITIYGNTIGIDLVDKTVYIPETDKTSKKVFSVDGNELMQTSNILETNFGWKELVGGVDYTATYYIGDEPLGEFDDEFTRVVINFKKDELLGKKIRITAQEIVSNGDIYEEITKEYTNSSGVIDTADDLGALYNTLTVKAYLWDTVSSIDKKYSDTRDKYKNGKETAVIRCSIGDYYDHTGELKISKSRLPMVFEEGDKVIPMVYSMQEKRDVPMSYYTDGETKIFQVLKVDVFYDGAVWQELTLQEV